MTQDIVKLIYKWDYLQFKAVAKNVEQIFNEYRETRNDKIQLAKKDYFNKVAQEYTLDATWTWNETNGDIGNSKSEIRYCPA